ncbi:MAG: hypothetical protein JXQ75_05570 [Phycisphaerae bacterium]|nr:hypothetical protein [Phycisphaerae bacterium]
MKRQLLLACGLCAVLAPGAMGDPGIGDKAPKVSAGSWWNLPEGLKSAGTETFQGQVVLVEFWTTW